MEVIFRLINENYLRIQRHAFQTNPNGNSMFQTLDDLIRQKDNFINYMKNEYRFGFIYNITSIVPPFIYLFIKSTEILNNDSFVFLWLLAVILIKFIELFPKYVLFKQIVKVEESIHDPVIASRKLMYLTRCNIFFYHSILGIVVLLQYLLYFFFIKRPNKCQGAPQLYNIIQLMIIGFFGKLIITFANYYLHFKYSNNGQIDEFSDEIYNEYQNRVHPDVLKLIRTVVLDNNNINKYAPINEEERELCSICMVPFQIADLMKILPCNIKHVFHDKCIDKWLSSSKQCPTCRKEINSHVFRSKKRD